MVKYMIPSARLYLRGAVSGSLETAGHGVVRRLNVPLELDLSMVIEEIAQRGNISQGQACAFLVQYGWDCLCDDLDSSDPERLQDILDSINRKMNQRIDSFLTSQPENV